MYLHVSFYKKIVNRSASIFFLHLIGLSWHPRAVGVPGPGDAPQKVTEHSGDLQKLNWAQDKPGRMAVPAGDLYLSERSARLNTSRKEFDLEILWGGVVVRRGSC